MDHAQSIFFCAISGRLAAGLIALFLVAPRCLFADWSPIGIGFFGTDGTQYPGTDDAIYGINLGVFVSDLGNLKGASFSTIATMSDETDGISIAGIFNKADASADGIFIAGIFNRAESSTDGVIQVAGLGNVLDGEGQGLQIAGGCNIAKDFTGTQVAAGNFSMGYFNGVQIGYMNISEKMTGIQIGIFNGGMPDGEMNGIQIGLFNELIPQDHRVQEKTLRHKTVSGFQISVINVADKMDGFQIGAINIAHKANAVQIGALNIATDSFSGIQIGALNISGGSKAAVLPWIRVAF